MPGGRDFCVEGGERSGSDFPGKQPDERASGGDGESIGDPSQTGDARAGPGMGAGKQLQRIPLATEGSIYTPPRQSKRKALSISPPQNISAGYGACVTPNTRNISVVDYFWNEEKGQSTEKKRQKTEVATNTTKGTTLSKSDRLQRKVLELLKRLDKETGNLQKLVRENRNTKVEIKEEVEKVRSTATQIMTRDLMSILANLDTKEVTMVAETADVGLQTSMEGGDKLEAKANTVSFGTQTEDVSKTIDMEVIKTELANSKKNYERFALINRIGNWPKECFEMTQTIDGHISSMPTRAGSATLIGNTAEGREKAKRQSERQGELKEMTEAGCVAGELKYIIERYSKVLCEKDDDMDTEQTKINVAGVIEEGRGPPETYKMIDRMMRLAKKHGVQELYVNPMGIKEPKTLRRILEYVGRDLQIKTIVFREQRWAVDTNSSEEWETKINPKRRETIVIHTDSENAEMSYANVMKRLRNGINVTDVGVHVAECRKAKGGIELKITERKQGAATQFIKEIDKVMSGQVAAKKTERRIQMLIKDLEDGVDREEISEAIDRAFGITKKEEIEVRDPRPPQYGKGPCSAIVIAPCSIARQLLDLSKIKIGWKRCRIAELVTPPRCYKCQTFGHTAYECKENSSKKRKCLKCGDEDHVARECKNALKCYVCGTPGHRADSMSCEKYRTAVSLARNKTNNNPNKKPGTSKVKATGENATTAHETNSSKP